MSRRLAAALSIALLAVAAPAAAQEIGGKYALAGETSAGAPYQGSISIAPRDQAFEVDWARAPGLAHRGFALQLGNVLGVAAEDDEEDYGVVLYRVKGGHLDGIWQGNLNRRVLALGHETLDGPEGLDGQYTISVGLNPNGSHYGGDVTIHRVGQVYAVDWRSPQPGYIGTGVLVGDIFVVGYGQNRRSAVAAYCLRSANAIEGVTALADDTALGAEAFWPANAKPPPPERLAELRKGNAAGDCGAPIATLPSLPNTRTAEAGLR
jgi:hypothetical protein